MGYTHYWQFNKFNGMKIADLERRYQSAIDDCAKIARHWNTKLYPKDSAGDAMRLSGYTAHCKPSNGYRGIHLNGKGDLKHEDFTLREHFRQSLNIGMDFCKTAEKPYDQVIAACLAVFKHHLGHAITVSSDGSWTDWVSGTLLASKVLRKTIDNPIREAA